MPKDGEHNEEEQDLPENLRGKTAKEIADMYSALETKLGEQGEELGRLRIQATQRPAPAPVEREPARKSEYARYAEDLIVNPEEVVPQLGAEIERRAVERASEIVTQRMSTQTQVENFFRANPELDKHRDIVSVIGERVYAANPNASMAQVLEETKRQAATYIAGLEERFTGKKRTEADRKRNAITTSGGAGREKVEDDETDTRDTGMSAEQQSVLDEIKRIKAHREKRMQPPRSR